MPHYSKARTHQFTDYEREKKKKLHAISAQVETTIIITLTHKYT